MAYTDRNPAGGADQPDLEDQDQFFYHADKEVAADAADAARAARAAALAVRDKGLKIVCGVIFLLGVALTLQVRKPYSAMNELLDVDFCFTHLKNVMLAGDLTLDDWRKLVKAQKWHVLRDFIVARTRQQ